MLVLECFTIESMIRMIFMFYFIVLVGCSQVTVTNRSCKVTNVPIGTQLASQCQCFMRISTVIILWWNSGNSIHNHQITIIQFIFTYGVGGCFPFSVHSNPNRDEKETWFIIEFDRCFREPAMFIDGVHPYRHRLLTTRHSSFQYCICWTQSIQFQVNIFSAGILFLLDLGIHVVYD